MTTNNFSKRKRFKVKLKRSDIVQPPIEISSTGPAADQIHRFMRTQENPGSCTACNSILGIEGAVAETTVANEVQTSAISESVERSVLRQWRTTPTEWGVQTTRICVVPGSAAVIDVRAARKAFRLYSQADVDAIVIVTVGPVPLETDPLGFGLAVDVRAIVFGPNAQAKLTLIEAKSRPRRAGRPSHRGAEPRRSGAGWMSRSPIVWYKSDDKAALKLELAKLFNPLLTATPEGAGHQMPMPDSWDEPEAKQLRGFVTLMARSMLPLKKALMLIGAGQSVVIGAIANAELELKKARRASEPVIPADGVPHFWFAELRRLGLDNISVPLVKLR